MTCSCSKLYIVKQSSIHNEKLCNSSVSKFKLIEKYLKKVKKKDITNSVKKFQV